LAGASPPARASGRLDVALLDVHTHLEVSALSEVYVLLDPLALPYAFTPFTLAGDVLGYPVVVGF
jgi:hypothetical protein